MIERFRGKRDVLIDALKEQKLVRGDASLAARIADMGELVEIKPGAAIMSEGDSGCDVYLILAGSFEIFVHGRSVARRGVGEHVGEISVALPSQVCSATVRATELSVAIRITHAQFTELAAVQPEIWRTIARDLAMQLEERNALVPTDSRQGSALRDVLDRIADRGACDSKCVRARSLHRDGLD